MQETRTRDDAAASEQNSVRSQIEAADRRFCESVARGDVAGAAANVYTSDAVILPPGAAMVRGRDDIVAFWQAAASELQLEQVNLTTVDLRDAGEFVHQIGKAELVLGGQRVEGKYTVLWKQEDGAWKWHVDCWNMNS